MNIFFWRYAGVANFETLNVGLAEYINTYKELQPKLKKTLKVSTKNGHSEVRMGSDFEN